MIALIVFKLALLTVYVLALLTVYMLVDLFVSEHKKKKAIKRFAPIGNIGDIYKCSKLQVWGIAGRISAQENPNILFVKHPNGYSICHPNTMRIEHWAYFKNLTLNNHNPTTNTIQLEEDCGNGLTMYYEIELKQE